MTVNSCLSIFYHQKSMHRLLEKLRLLLKQQDVQSAYNDYFVFISSERGTSIRLILKTEQEKQEATCSYLFTQLENWLRDHPSKQYPANAAVTGLFLNFPNNYLRYNLYPSSEVASEELKPLHKVLSELLLSFFGNHPLNEEALFTFSLYLHHHFCLSLDNRNDRASLQMLFSAMTKVVPTNSEEVLDFDAPTDIQILFDGFRHQCRRLRLNHSPARLYNIFLTLLKSHLSLLGDELVVKCYSRLGLTNAIYS